MSETPDTGETRNADALNESVSDPLNESTASDPFHPNNVGTIQFIMLARIYDLLMLDLNERSPEKAKMVAQLHHKGKILGPMPVFDGTFVFSEEETSDSTAPNE